MRVTGAENANGGRGGDVTDGDVGAATAPLGAPRASALARPPADVGRPSTVGGRERDAPLARPGRGEHARAARAVMTTRARIRWRGRAERSRPRARAGTAGGTWRAAPRCRRGGRSLFPAKLVEDGRRDARISRAEAAARRPCLERIWILSPSPAGPERPPRRPRRGGRTPGVGRTRNAGRRSLLSASRADRGAAGAVAETARAASTRRFV